MERLVAIVGDYLYLNSNAMQGRIALRISKVNAILPECEEYTAEDGSARFRPSLTFVFGDRNKITYDGDFKTKEEAYGFVNTVLSYILERIAK